MSSVTPISSTPDVVHLLSLRRALDGQRTLADGILALLSPTPPAQEKVGTPAVSRVSSAIDLRL